MLYADKRALETNLQVSLLKIREKELQFYTQNCIAIGTQAALLSGFAYNGIIQVCARPHAPPLRLLHASPPSLARARAAPMMECRTRPHSDVAG